MTRLGPHVQHAGRLAPEGWAWVREAPIVKAMDDPEPLRQARPGAITIFRAFLENWRQDTTSPEAFFDLVLSRLGGFRPTYVEGLNEHKARAEFGLAAYVEWTRRFVDLCHGAGLKVAGFSFPTGNPEPSDWQMLKAAGFAGVDALSIHEYWGACGPAASQWNARRHELVHQWLGGAHPPMIVTECGRDAVVQDGSAGRPGWRKQDVGDDAYLAELLAYGQLLPDYVLGYLPFTIAAFDNWTHFAYDNLVPKLRAATPSVLDEGAAHRPESSTGAAHQPPEEEEHQMPFQFQLGFKAFADAHPDLVGAPTSDLYYYPIDSPFCAVQYTTKGKLEWNKASDQVLFFRARLP